MEKQSQLPVAIIGGGPVGMAAAAHLVQRDMPFILLEQGKSIGANILSWGHIRVFSPWQYNIDKAAEALLIKNGWIAPDKEGLPTGKEIVEQYLLPLAQLPELAPHIYTNATVVAISRKNTDKMKDAGRENQPFEIRVKQGVEHKFFEAQAIIDASGTWQNPNPIGSGGYPAPGEDIYTDYINYGIPDITGAHKLSYANKNVLVVGGGHSAINAILELDKLKSDYPKTEIHWILRKKYISQVYGGQGADQLAARGALGIKIEELVLNERVSVYTPFSITEIQHNSGKLNIVGVQNGTIKMLSGVERIISNTGSRPDYSMLRELRVEADASVESVPALANLIDPNLHSCGTVRPHGEKELRQKEKDFYIVGAKSYGRAPTFLMATGYEQVRSVVAAMAGDWEAAERVELDLPETGVCNSGLMDGDECCGIPLKKTVNHIEAIPQ